ncbi:endonuclease III [Candidatus Symbiobacter mobilis]|uniref:Endonuclease III n=1 Tax=Candidatus Symbiobacter mobilis CR TaxID=946483 RepID=U5N7B5_9BURK|nr:endonuclease III [Candidatus Symbiobacter mobilis]AGX87200.1 endonuclease III [Candidatus Symbiobacter mobilis CR]
MSADEIAGFFAALSRTQPEPRTELAFSSPFELLTAVVLSAQSTDAGVNKATQRLFPLARTPQAMLELGLERLEHLIRTIGLYRTKARHLIELSAILVQHHGGAVPRTRTELEALPGVGRKTANVVLHVAFGESTVAVDTHVFRVANRTGLAPGKTPLAVEHALLARIPPAFLHHAHHWLVLHGRYVCLARKPRCIECPVQSYCRFVGKPCPTTPTGPTGY